MDARDCRREISWGVRARALCSWWERSCAERGRGRMDFSSRPVRRVSCGARVVSNQVRRSREAGGGNDGSDRRRVCYLGGDDVDGREDRDCAEGYVGHVPDRGGDEVEAARFGRAAVRDGAAAQAAARNGKSAEATRLPKKEAEGVDGRPEGGEEAHACLLRTERAMRRLITWTGEVVAPFGTVLPANEWRM